MYDRIYIPLFRGPCMMLVLCKSRIRSLLSYIHNCHTLRMGTFYKKYQDKTYRRQNVSGQNVSPAKRIGYKTYRLQNVSKTKRIGRQNVLATKQIGDIMYHLQNVLADKTYLRTKHISGQNVSADKTFRQIVGKLELIFNISFFNFKGTPSQVEHQTVFRSQSRTGTWTWTWTWT
jgi:hypothetical protein